MTEQPHPLVAYAKASNKSLEQIAKAAKCSRMTLYRIMRGENATTDLVQRVSDATEGAVPPSAFFPKRESAA